MQALAWIVRFAIVVVLIWFALRNSQTVTLYGLPGDSWQAPLVFALLVAVAEDKHGQAAVTRALTRKERAGSIVVF